MHNYLRGILFYKKRLFQNEEIDRELKKFFHLVKLLTHLLWDCLLFKHNSFVPFVKWKQNREQPHCDLSHLSTYPPPPIVFSFFVFLIFNFISPNVCHWDVFFLEGRNWIYHHWDNYFSIFFVTKQAIFLSQWPFSLFVGKTCLSNRIFSEMFFACGLINWRVTFGNSFFTQKSCLKDISRQLF